VHKAPSVALLSLKKKRPDLASKDVLRLIAQMMLDKRSVAKEEWGRPRFYQQQFLMGKQTKEFVFVFIGLCLIWLIKMLFVFEDQLLRLFLIPVFVPIIIITWELIKENPSFD
jgi:hypothetical protein